MARRSAASVGETVVCWLMGWPPLGSTSIKYHHRCVQEFVSIDPIPVRYQMELRHLRYFVGVAEIPPVRPIAQGGAVERGGDTVLDRRAANSAGRRGGEASRRANRPRPGRNAANRNRDRGILARIGCRLLSRIPPPAAGRATGAASSAFRSSGRSHPVRPTGCRVCLEYHTLGSRIGPPGVRAGEDGPGSARRSRTDEAKDSSIAGSSEPSVRLVPPLGQPGLL